MTDLVRPAIVVHPRSTNWVRRRRFAHLSSEVVWPICPLQSHTHGIKFSPRLKTQGQQSAHATTNAIHAVKSYARAHTHTNTHTHPLRRLVSPPIYHFLVALQSRTLLLRLDDIRSSILAGAIWINLTRALGNHVANFGHL